MMYRKYSYNVYNPLAPRMIHIHVKRDCLNPGIVTEKKKRTGSAIGTVTEIEEETEIGVGTGI